MGIEVEVIQGGRLPEALAAEWAELQEAAPVELRSPFVRPEFTAAVGQVRADVEVAVLREGGRAVGFFPFQRSRWNVGRPVGSRLSDLQAMLVRPGVEWDAAELVRACGLAVWDFHILFPSREELVRYAHRAGESAYMDLSGGFEAYRAARREAGSEKLKQAAKLARRAERDVGPLRFVADSHEPEVMQALLAWKSQRYRATGALDVLAQPWVRALLEAIRRYRGDGFRPLVSALYFGDQLAAVEMGLRSHAVLHGWFSTYNPELSKYSPGTLLGVELAKAAEPLGIRRLELGKNNLPYKASFATGTYPVLKGSIAVHPLWRAMRCGSVTLRRIADMPPLAGSRRMAQRFFSPARDWIALR